MKVIFLESVPNIAQAGETKEVANGYGRNFLLPRKLAVVAGSSASSLVETQLKKRARLQAETEAEMRLLAEQLEGKEVILKARSGEKERLYGSITSADIADELAKNGVVVDKRKIDLAEPVRQLGSYEITIRLGKDITPKIKLTVLGEEGEAGKEAGAQAEDKKAEEGKKKEPKAEKKRKIKEGKVKEPEVEKEKPEEGKEEKG